MAPITSKLEWLFEPLKEPVELAQYILSADNDSEEFEQARFFIYRHHTTGALHQHLQAILAVPEVKQVAEESRYPSDYAFAQAIYERCCEIIDSDPKRATGQS